MFKVTQRKAEVANVDLGQLDRRDSRRWKGTNVTNLPLSMEDNVGLNYIWSGRNMPTLRGFIEEVARDHNIPSLMNGLDKKPKKDLAQLAYDIIQEWNGQIELGTVEERVLDKFRTSGDPSANMADSTVNAEPEKNLEDMDCEMTEDNEDSGMTVENGDHETNNHEAAGGEGHDNNALNHTEGSEPSPPCKEPRVITEVRNYLASVINRARSSPQSQANNRHPAVGNLNTVVDDDHVYALIDHLLVPADRFIRYGKLAPHPYRRTEVIRHYQQTKGDLFKEVRYGVMWGEGVDGESAAAEIVDELFPDHH
ncbi:hypothetical protein CC80DRAFT_505204 [Byssothecium circinans]|uniref:Uncharacterized protein n=1 Tax=Byssothecium circinans TaxID=147558 RepID=A0A6A5TUB7_9PLEO|nr:hypothetical protein CC80DRAFT_505204 [Byssothecium circinans]